MEKLYCVILLHNKETCTIQNIFIKIVSGQSLAHLSGEFLEYQSKSQDWVNLRLIVQLSEVYQYHTMYHVSTYTKQSLTMSIYAGSVLKQTPSVLFTETTAVSLDIYLIQWYMISSYSEWFMIKNQKWKKKSIWDKVCSFPLINFYIFTMITKYLKTHTSLVWITEGN